MLGDTFSEWADANEAGDDIGGQGSRRPILGEPGNPGVGPDVRAVLVDAFREPSDTDNARTDVGGMEDLREGLHGVVGEAERDGQATEPEPSNADDESPHSPG